MRLRKLYFLPIGLLVICLFQLWRCRIFHEKFRLLRVGVSIEEVRSIFQDREIGVIETSHGSILFIDSPCFTSTSTVRSVIDGSPEI